MFITRKPYIDDINLNSQLFLNLIMVLALDSKTQR